MDFEGVGTIPYEAADEVLKPFFRRKYRTAFRLFGKLHGEKGIMKKTDAHQFVERITSGIPEERRQMVQKTHFEVQNIILLFGKDRITEDEFVQEWMNIAFGSPEKRKEQLTAIRPYLKHGFDSVDLDNNGVIDAKEFEQWYEVRSMDHDTTELVYKALDKNGDGVISLEEWAYGMMDFWFCSGPDDNNSLYFGEIVHDD